MIKPTQRFLVFKAFCRLAYVHFTCHRSNFFGLVLYWLVSISVLLIFWRVLFRFLPQAVEDWTFERLCILNAICYISWGIFVLFWGIHQIPDKVITGQLDKFLSKPVSPLLCILFEEIKLIGLCEIASGVLVLASISYFYNISPNCLQIAMSSVAILLGTFALLLLHGTVSLVSFWAGRIHIFQSLLDDFDEFQRYPTSFFPGSIRAILMTVVPLYFPGTFSARIYLGLPVPIEHWIVCLTILGVWGAIFLYFYTGSIKRYEANG